MNTTLSYTETFRTFAAMQRHGGGFCAALSRAWMLADSTNKRRIEDAFPHLLEDFGPGSRYYSETSF